ncbi:MAG: glucosamine-6-phosphate deaminase [Waddliaceae bacterium]|nr:glucosamine-6-phosphate deaminase [Waddliaceae bacterium]
MRDSQIKYRIFSDEMECADACANRICKKMQEAQKDKQAFSLGLATGSTPIPIYKFLTKYSVKNKLDWSNIHTFNLDEYVGISAEDPQSFSFFMFSQLFDRLLWSPKRPYGLPLENIHLLNGLAKKLEDLDILEIKYLGKYWNKLGEGRGLSKEQEELILDLRCQKYEQLLHKYGPVDIQLLGIGSNGHIAFVEPGSAPSSKTSIVSLSDETRQANARFFQESSLEVPERALSMGIATILKAKEIALVATGESKADAVARALNGPITDLLPASHLQKHQNIVFYLDKAAASLI